MFGTVTEWLHYEMEDRSHARSKASLPTQLEIDLERLRPWRRAEIIRSITHWSNWLYSTYLIYYEEKWIKSRIWGCHIDDYKEPHVLGYKAEPLKVKRYSEEHIASVFGVEGLAKQETIIKTATKKDCLSCCLEAGHLHLGEPSVCFLHT
jgi:hypothetical protein